MHDGLKYDNPTNSTVGNEYHLYEPACRNNWLAAVVWTHSNDMISLFPEHSHGSSSSAITADYGYYEYYDYDYMNDTSVETDDDPCTVNGHRYEVGK